MREEQAQQATAVAKRDAETQSALATKRMMRSGQRRGLLAFADDQALGGSA